MTALVRRTWYQIRREVMERVSFKGASVSQERAERYIESAYFDIATLYHHYELDNTDATIVLTTGTSTEALPADTYSVFQVLLFTPVSLVFDSALLWQAPQAVLQKWSDTNAKPTIWTRWASDLVFPSPPDQDYPITLYYYKTPTAPDYASGSPETARHWDEHIIEGAVAKALGAIWEAGQLQTSAQLLAEYTGQVSQAVMEEGLSLPSPKRPADKLPPGGKQ
jgi:hypothetical protein